MECQSYFLTSKVGIEMNICIRGEVMYHKFEKVKSHSETFVSIINSIINGGGKECIVRF